MIAVRAPNPCQPLGGFFDFLTGKSEEQAASVCCKSYGKGGSVLQATYPYDPKTEDPWGVCAKAGYEDTTMGECSSGVGPIAPTPAPADTQQPAPTAAPAPQPAPSGQQQAATWTPTQAIAAAVGVQLATDLARKITSGTASAAEQAQYRDLMAQQRSGITTEFLMFGGIGLALVLVLMMTKK